MPLQRHDARHPSRRLKVEQDILMVRPCLSYVLQRSNERLEKRAVLIGTREDAFIGIGMKIEAGVSECCGSASYIRGYGERQCPTTP